MDTVTIFVELPADVHDRLLAHLQQHPDLYPDGGCSNTPMDQFVADAITSYLDYSDQIESGRALLRRLFEERA